MMDVSDRGQGLYTGFTITRERRPTMVNVATPSRYIQQKSLRECTYDTRIEIQRAEQGKSDFV